MEMLDTRKDEVIPNGRWEFDKDVADVFDDMLARSIPDYETMRGLVTQLAVRYANPNEWIVDLGCSHGESIARIIDRVGPECRYKGVEISQPMRERAEERFKDQDYVHILDLDLREQFPNLGGRVACVTLSVLTLMFIPVEHRMRILQTIYQNTHGSGALIIVEKLLGEGPEINQALVDSYYAMKSANGYTEEQIERKRLALEGVLVPMTAKWNVEMLHLAGFTKVDCFWRSLNFAGFIALP